MFELLFPPLVAVSERSLPEKTIMEEEGARLMIPFVVVENGLGGLKQDGVCIQHNHLLEARCKSGERLDSPPAVYKVEGLVVESFQYIGSAYVAAQGRHKFSII